MDYTLVKSKACAKLRSVSRTVLFLAFVGGPNDY